ncbi:40S ribosomal protein [Didymella keratinophila]|nr:40S ribosomal protein [Didymella keratinophila]
MPGLESMRRRLSSIAKPHPDPTTPPSHTHSDKRLLDPDFFNIDAEDLTWFHKVNLAVRHDVSKLSIAHDYMHIQRVTVAAYQLYCTDASQIWAQGIDHRTVVVAAMVSSMTAVLYVKDQAEKMKDFGPRTPDSLDAIQAIQHDLLFDFLRRLDCPPDVAGPAALIASSISFELECKDQDKIKDNGEAFPAMRFVQDAVLDDFAALTDLENNVPDLKSSLRPLQFVSAREIEVGHGRKAIVIFVPVPLLQGWHKAQQRLTRELEKKFSDRHVLIVASRRILPRPKRSNRSRTSQTQKRPQSRTLTAVHDAILSDLVYPVEIVGKRLRTREDGSKVLKVVLDEKERGGVDYRLDTYSEVYKRLTGKGVNFEFPQSAAEY